MSLLTRCTSDKRERMLDVIKAYTAKIVSGNTTSIPKELLPESSAMSAAEARPIAISMARDAFSIPKRYYFDEADGVPTHCLDLDLITFEVLESATSDTDLHKYFCDYNQFLWMFLDHKGHDEFATIPNAARLAAVARKLHGFESSTNSLAQLIQPITCDEKNESIAVFGSPYPKWAIVARMCVILIMLYDAFTPASWVLIVAKIIELAEGSASLRKRIVTLLASSEKAETFEQLVGFSLTQLTIVVSSTDNDKVRHQSASLIEILFEANFASHPPPLPYTAFYFPIAQELDMEEIKEDYIREQKGLFALMHYPCLLDAAYKSAVMQLEAHLEYSGAVRSAMLSSILGSQLRNAQLDTRNFFLQLRVRRSDIVTTALKELQINISNLRKPLRITFEGEDGIDEGGLRKEFFQLLCKELLSPDHGMFTAASDNRQWLVSDQKNDYNRREFWLVGMVIGLAVFNNIVLDVAFPMVLFKKLLGMPVTIEDLESVDAELYHGLKALLAFEETDGMTVEDAFGRTFEHSEDIFGAPVVTELCPGGKDKVLTIDNREEYVRLLSDYMLDRMVSTNFGEFKKGFDQVCARGLIQQRNVRPEELELLVCGRSELDLKVLENSASYDGFEADDQIIQDFWSIVHDLSQENKKKFLKFCTGSDRVPVRGLEDLKFVIGRNGDSQAMLPTSHTCFNHLLIPVYESKEIMQDKLILAIQNCEGFGLR